MNLTNYLYKISLLVFISLSSITTHIKAQKFNPQKNSSISAFREMHFQSGKSNHATKAIVKNEQRPLSFSDSCATTVYRLILGKQQLSEKVNNVTVLKNNDVLLAGSIELTATDKDGLIAKLDKTGTVLWYRHYGNASTNESINKIRETSDGGSIAIGTVENNTTLERKILVLKMSNDGAIEWSNTISVSRNALQAEGTDIIELTGGGYAFAGDNKFSVIYGRLTTEGAIVWDKSTKLVQEQAALGIIEDYSGWFIGATGKDSGYSVTNIIKVDTGNGNIIWNDKLGGPSLHQHYIAQGIEITNLRPRIVGMYRNDNSAEWHLFRGTVNNISDIESIETYAFDTLVDSTGFSAITPWAEEIDFSSDNSNGIYLFRTVPDAPVKWKYQYTDANLKNIRSIERTWDGGLLMVGNQKENNGSATDIFIYKVDSAGLQPSCAGIPFSATVAKTAPFQLYRNLYNENVTNNLSKQSITIGSGRLAIDPVYSCQQLFCPPPLSADTCLQTFNKIYRSSSFCDLATKLSETTDHSLLAVGVMRDNPTDPATQRGFLVKFDKSGNVSERRKAPFQGTHYLDLLNLKDSSFLIPSFQNGKLMLTKIDQQLNQLWSTSYQLSGLNFVYNSGVQASDGSIYISILYDYPTLPYLLLLKFTGKGELVWQKNYAANNPTFVGFGYGKMIVMNDNIYFCTKTSDNGIYPSQIIIKFNKEDGSILWMKNLSSPGYHINSDAVFVGYGNKLLIAGNLSSPSPGSFNKAVLIQLNENGAVEKTKVFSTALNLDMFNSITIRKSGDILLGAIEYDYFSNPFTAYHCLIQLDADFNVKTAFKYELVSTGGAALITGGPAPLTETLDGSILEIGWNDYDEPYKADFFIRKYSPDLQSGTCPALPLTLDGSPFSILPTGLNMKVNPAVVITPANESFQTVEYDLNVNASRCSSVANCNTIKLSGVQQICATVNDTFLFSAIRNIGCHLHVSFSMDSLVGKMVAQTDSSVKIKFSKGGTIMLCAEINAGCNIIKDSIPIDINLSTDSLNLGPDLQVCGNTAYTLHAGSGYKTYRWQDNSTDSILPVSSPGLYYVTVQDFCGKILSDSVMVALAQPSPLFAGADTFKCNKDSITLIATAGFASYSWQPNDHITDASSQTVKVYPATTTTWYLQAEKNPGCISKDTITITVYNTPVINLGADTSFCTGGSVILDAGSQFQRWRWNDGDTTRLRTLALQGIYSVKAFDEHGCFSTDTFSILSVFAKPVVNLDKDSVLCEGTRRVLDAGAGFSAYGWNNGSISQSIEINNTGKFWVQVTDDHHCVGGDTTEIKLIALPPANFASKDTAICTYESVLLRATASFSSYLWSSGNNTNSIEVSTPGIYWLQVTDSNGCFAKQFIQVMPKDCAEAIYFPKAFSPNNNSLNDNYRPGIFGIPANYHFAIFDRYGEKVFETNEYNKGWNGTFNGANQNAGTFVWICTFKFSNGLLRNEKGTFILMR